MVKSNSRQGKCSQFKNLRRTQGKHREFENLKDKLNIKKIIAEKNKKIMRDVDEVTFEV